MDDAPAEQDVTATDPDGGKKDGRVKNDDTPGQPEDSDAAPGMTAHDASTTDSGKKVDAGPALMCNGGTVATPGATLKEAKELQLGKVCGQLALAATDWFTYDVGEVGNLHLSFTADGDARLLMQSAGGGIALAMGSGSAENFQTTGVWNLRVLSDTGRVQGYTLTRLPSN